MSSVFKIILSILFWGIFAYVVWQVAYPDSLTQADSLQMLSFFAPLFLALIFTIDIFLKFLIRSIIISFAIVILLVLKALDSINTISVILLLAATALFFSYFKKSSPSTSSGLRNLTSEGNIPKLTRWRKQSRHPEEPLRRRRI